jgi:uncharacterized protein (DUF1778 family)
MPSIARAKRTPSRPSNQRSTATVNLRVPQETRELIDNAAAALGKSRTEFMLESARREAIDVLLDQRLFVLTPEQHEEFMRILDNPPPPNEALKKLMRSTPPWEK